MGEARTQGGSGAKVKARKLIVLAAVALFGVLVLAGGAVAVAVLVLDDGGPREPLATVLDGPLPDKVEQLSYSHGMNTWRGMKTPPVLDDAFLASIFCDGRNVAKTLVEAKGDDLDALASEGVLDLLADDELGASLRCGKKLRQALSARAMSVVKFADDDEDRQLFVLKASFDELPKLDRHNFRGLDGSCEKEEGESDCKEGGVAGVQADELWVAGPVEAVDAFARRWTSERTTETTDVRIARTLTEELSGGHEAVVNIKPETVLFVQGCVRAAPEGEGLAFVSACWPDDVGDTVERIVAETRGHAYELDFPLLSGRVRVVHTLLARDEGGAEDIERDLQDLVRDWQAHLENHEPELVEKVRAIEDDDQQDAKDAELQAFLRAASQMEIERSGRIVRLVMEADLTDAERRSMRAWLQRREEDIEVAARIVDTLEKGDKPAQKDLAHFVGSEAAEWMRLPRASETECDEIRDHFDQLVEEGVATEQYGAKFRVDKELGKDRCVGSPMPDTRKKCLLNAKDVGAMDACPQPRSPFEMRALETLAGKWKVAKLIRSHQLEWRTRRALESAEVEVGGDRMAWGVDRVVVGPLNLAASDTDSFSIDLPGFDPPLRMQVRPDPEDADRVRLVDSDGFGLVLAPASYDDSLFDRPKADG